MIGLERPFQIGYLNHKSLTFEQIQSINKALLCPTVKGLSGKYT